MDSSLGAERQMEAKLSKDKEEEDTCDFHHSNDHFDSAQNNASGTSSNCTSENVDIHEEPGTNASSLN